MYSVVEMNMFAIIVFRKDVIENREGWDIIDSENYNCKSFKKCFLKKKEKDQPNYFYLEQYYKKWQNYTRKTLFLQRTETSNVLDYFVYPTRVSFTGMGFSMGYFFMQLYNRFSRVLKIWVSRRFKNDINRKLWKNINVQYQSYNVIFQMVKSSWGNVS